MRSCARLFFFSQLTEACIVVLGQGKCVLHLPACEWDKHQKKIAIERVPVSLSGGCFRVGVDGKGEIKRLDGWAAERLVEGVWVWADWGLLAEAA